MTDIQRLAAELIYKAAMLPAQNRGSIADCARKANMRVSAFLRALRVLDIVRYDAMKDLARCDRHG